MLIRPKPFQHWIDNFFGYGAWDARIWFVANDEGGGDTPEEVAEKLNYFYEHHPTSRPSLCDLRDMYRHVAFRFSGPKAGLFRTLYDYRFGPLAVLHGSWKNLIAFVSGYHNETMPDALTYQLNSFARSDAALIRLYPLPSATSHAWYYNWLDLPEFPFLRSRAAYMDHLFNARIHHLLENLAVQKPEVVMMYGMTNINALKRAVIKHFPSVRFRMVKAIKMQVPQHHIVAIGQTTLVITTQIPALRHNRVETGFDWYGLGRMIRSGV